MKVGVGLLLIFGFCALAAPLLAPFGPDQMVLPEQFSGPSLQHWLGQDENGSDVFAKLVFGARVSLGVAGAVLVVSVGVGLVVGTIAGYCGGVVEQTLMALTDIVYAFPSFLLALTLVAFLGASIRNLIVALCLTSWTGFARLVRGEILHLKEREFVTSARALGASHPRIVALYLWPNLFGLLLVQSTFAMASTIVSESGLSFLGLGVPVETPTWGSLLQSGRRVLLEAPHIELAAALAIVTAVLGFNLVGEGLRHRLDPRRGRNSV